MTEQQPAWDGRPQNPERDGWHWVSLLGSDTPIAACWGDDEWAGPYDNGRYLYLGPCLTPTEIERLIRLACVAIENAYKQGCAEAEGYTELAAEFSAFVEQFKKAARVTLRGSDQ
jgi:hypothetical protein